MNSILIIAHAPLANALREIALHVFPEASSDIAAFDVQSDANPQESLKLAEYVLNQLIKTEQIYTVIGGGKTSHLGCLILCDVMGATPCNVAAQLVTAQLLANHEVRLIAGVNVPMLLRAMTYRHEPLEQLAARAVAGGMQGVLAVTMTAPQYQTQKPQSKQSQLYHDKNHHDHQQ